MPCSVSGLGRLREDAGHDVDVAHVERKHFA